jgi:hypothetical protein
MTSERRRRYQWDLLHFECRRLAYQGLDLPTNHHDDEVMQSW